MVPQVARLLRRAALLAATLLSVAISVSTETAAQSPPARIANIWNHRDHQPTRNGVSSAERAAGVAPSAEEKALVDDELQRLGEQLLQGEQPPEQPEQQPVPAEQPPTPSESQQ
jgi:hypothetical protein